MHRTLRLLALLPAALVLSGCVIAVGNDGWDEGDDDWQERQAENRRLIDGLVLGMDRDSVEGRLGAPDIVESFRRDGQEFSVLRYRTHRVKGDGETTLDETTPVVLADGEVVGWGESAIRYATAER